MEKLKLSENFVLGAITEDLAERASGYCLMKSGETSVLATAQIGQVKEGVDFFPLTCEYEERYYAAGKILGSRFIRREGRPSTEAVLISRAIDRSIRPLFPKKLKNEVQVISTCLSWDGRNEPAALSVNAASLALMLSEIPWEGPVGAVRVAGENGNFVLNPDYEVRERADFDLLVVGVENPEKKEEILVNMIEFQGQEVKESTVLQAIEFALPFIRKIIEWQKKISNDKGKPKIDFSLPDQETEEKIRKFLSQKDIQGILYQKNTQERSRALENLLSELKQEFSQQDQYPILIDVVKEVQSEILRQKIIEENRRPDGRKIDEIRSISMKAGILARTHGSGIFTRGETRTLSILTLGAPGDQQILEGMEISGKKRFLHHYNFPPYSAGEIRPLRAPNRREIGHGALVEKALFPLIPKFEDFPYTIRVVTEVLSSNGSTSMASVSSATLALLDGGVPLLRPAAGIAIGLITYPQGHLSKYRVLTDIQGPEDALGDMDFKVAGTSEGITAIQMDVKIRGINREILKEALERGKKARNEILEIQKGVLFAPRPSLSPFAPRVYTIQINPEKIGMVIGTGGKVINEIIENCGVSIDIEESGKVFVTGESEEAVQKAIKWIKNITQEIEIGQVFHGKVKRIFNFGALVEIVPGQEGLVHISELADFHIKNIHDILKIGDVIPVKVINIDEQGRIALSAKKAGFVPKVKNYHRISSHRFRHH